MRKTVSSVVICGALFALTLSPVQATTILIDANDAAAPLGTDTWNELTTTSTTIADLVDIVGGSTGYSATLGGTWGTSGSTDSISGSSSDTQIWNGAADYFFVGSAPGTGSATITFGSLNASSTYDIDIVGSRSANGNRSVDVTIDGSFSDAPVSSDNYNAFTTGYTSGRVLKWAGVSPTSNSIVVTFVTPESNFGYMNAVRITEISAVVPEPSTITMTLLLLGCLAATRRHRKFFS